VNFDVSAANSSFPEFFMHPKAAQVIHFDSLGMNQRQIAEQLGISQPTVNRILRDPANRTVTVTVDSDLLTEAEATHSALNETIQAEGIVVEGKPNPLIRELAVLEQVAREQGLFDRKLARLFTMMVQGQVGRIAEVKVLRELTGLDNGELVSE
jgi:transcriptional regulator with XRE-family HTH domain